MGLVVTQLVLRDFRSYELFELDPDPSLTILVGPNAAGKTNVIEAIQLVTAGDSFRRPQWPELVRWGAQEASVTLHAIGENRVLETELSVGPSGRRTYRVNGKIRRRISEVAGVVPCVTFTPDDLRLVKDSADRRRGAIDGVGDQLSPAYMAARLEYERVVRQRNALLKNPEANAGVFEALTDRLVVQGALFMGHRHRLFDRVSERMSDVYTTLSQGERLKARYVPSWERGGMRDEPSSAEEALRSSLRARRAEEVARGLTLLGPHRDEVEFKVNGREARAFASQGQMRTIALAWKLAEVAVIKDIAGQAPVLLLDDVMSELDEARRHALAAFVGEAAQTFLTTTNLGYFEKDLVSRARVVSVG
jgi:DNA replication and repair protein RecF